MPRLEVLQAQTLLIHGIDCRLVMGTMLAGANRWRVDVCTVCGVMWLGVVQRRWGKHLSLMVMYLNCPVVVRGNWVWFSSALHPVDHCVFVP